MAKLSAHGTEIERLEDGTTRYSIRSDGSVLRQWRLCGTWAQWTVYFARRTPQAMIDSLRKRVLDNTKEAR